jgi:hypothetical protein
LRGLDWQAFLSALKQAHYIYLPLLIVWSSLSYLVRALRWRVLLTREKPLALSNVFWANMAGYLGNNLLPARAGELIRAAYIAKQENISGSFALATGLVERLVDMLALLILGSISLAYAGLLTGPLQTGLQVVAAIGAIGLLTIFLLPIFKNSLVKIISVIPILKENPKNWLIGFLNEFIQGLQSLHHAQRAGTFILLTSVIWLLDGFGTVIMARALNINMPIQQSFVLLAGLGLSSAIPSTPGYVGVYQFMAVTVLMPFGYSKEDSIALVLFLQILGYIVIALWGGISIWKANRLLIISDISTSQGQGHP